MLYHLFSFARFPKQVRFILWNEAAERYAFYGMRVILVIYLSQFLKIADNLSAAIYSYFNAFAYLSPILGAYMADRYLGKYKAIVYCSIIYAVGFFTLALVPNLDGLMIGLFLIGLGTGGIKPCVSTFMADQLDPNLSNYETLRAETFTMLYFMVNFGSLLATFLAPLTRTFFGPQIAFLVPAILMLVSLVIFLMGSKYYIHITTKKHEHAPVLKVLVSGIKNFKTRTKGDTWLSGAEKDFGRNAVVDTHNLLQVIKVFILLVIFYAVWDQQGSSWVQQGLIMNNVVFGVHVPPEIMQFINPFLILFLIPVFNKWLYPALNKMFNLTIFKKIGIGITLAGLSFFTLGLLQTSLDHGHKISLLWQAIPYVLMTCGEIFVIITAMEFSYAKAPQSMKSIIMSFFWLTVFGGDLLAGVILQVNIFKGASLFFAFGGLALFCTLLFIPISKSYNHLDN